MNSQTVYDKIENTAKQFSFKRDLKTTIKRGTGEIGESDKSIKFSRNETEHFYIIKNSGTSVTNFLAVFDPALKETLNEISGLNGLPNWKRIEGGSDWAHYASLKEFPKRLHTGAQKIHYGYPIYFYDIKSLELTLENVFQKKHDIVDKQVSNTTQSTHKPINPSCDEQTFRLIEGRRGQGAFRDEALKRFNSRCIVTGSEITSILEAAHIMPYADVKDSREDNALLMRSDIHTLFDLGFLRIHINDQKKLIVKLEPELENSEYWEYHKTELDVIPSNEMIANITERNKKYLND